jgi:hypothetical protein
MTSASQWTFQTMQHVSVLRTAALDDQCNAMLLSCRYVLPRSILLSGTTTIKFMRPCSQPIPAFRPKEFQ